MWLVIFGLLFTLCNSQSASRVYIHNCKKNLPFQFDNYTKIIMENCGLTHLRSNFFGREGTRDLSNIQQLLVTDNNLTIIFDYSFSKGTQLRLLDISKNQILKLAPEAFNELKNLETLDLSSNNISSLDLQTFVSLQSAKYISLRDNSLATIDFNLFANHPSLQTVDLGRNQIAQLKCTDINGKFDISHLYLDHNNVTDISTLQILQDLVELDVSHNHYVQLTRFSFKNIRDLRQLLLADTNLRRLNNDFLFLKPQKRLVDLNLMDNNLERLNLNEFPPMKDLTTLNLKGNWLRHLDDEALLAKFPALKNVILSDNDWDCVELKIMANNMKYRNVTLAFMESNKDVGPVDNVDGVACSFKSDENRKGIERLDAIYTNGIFGFNRYELVIFASAMVNVLMLGLICCMYHTHRSHLKRSREAEITRQTFIHFAQPSVSVSSIDNLTLPPPPPPTY